MLVKWETELSLALKGKGHLLPQTKEPEEVVIVVASPPVQSGGSECPEASGVLRQPILEKPWREFFVKGRALRNGFTPREELTPWEASWIQCHPVAPAGSCGYS